MWIRARGPRCPRDDTSKGERNHAQYFEARAAGAVGAAGFRHLVVLCAGVGSRLGLGAKCCVDVGGASIFQRCADTRKEMPCEFIVVVGYEVKATDHCPEACAAVGLPKPAIISNDDYSSTTAKSSCCSGAVPALANQILLVDGDL